MVRLSEVSSNMSNCGRKGQRRKLLMIKRSHLAASCVGNHCLLSVWVKGGDQDNTVKAASLPELQSDTGGGETERGDLVW